MTTATLNRPRAIRPQPGPQEAFLSSPADVVFYGGAAGGGKTYALLMEPLRHVVNAAFRGVIFRRTTPQIRNPGALWDEATELYPLLGAVGRETDLRWTFPSGAYIRMAHMQHEKDRHDWQGSQMSYIGFDELTQFTRGQFSYVAFSRGRSTSGVTPYIRAGMNPVPPEDPVGGWVAREFVHWYIDWDTGYAIPERSGVIRWFVVHQDEVLWADTRDELAGRFPMAPQSFTFIHSDVYDNQILMAADPAYVGKLEALNLVDRERLLRGNWKVRPAAGLIFNRDWFLVVPDCPTGQWEEVLFWDFAATARELDKDDPDYTAYCHMRRVRIEGQPGYTFVVLDAAARQLGPVETLRWFLTVSQKKAQLAGKTPFAVRWEIEPGSAAKREDVRLRRQLQGINARGVRATKDKITRATPFASSAENGDVLVLRGAWNERWLNHLHNQPDWPHDDEMDAASGAYEAALKGARRSRIR